MPSRHDLIYIRIMNMAKSRIFSIIFSTIKGKIYMKHSAILLCFLSLALPADAADSPYDLGMTEIMALGRLNGQALACSHTEAVARIKVLIIKLAPKSRRYGEAFETATNEAYLAQAKEDQSTCQDGTAIAGQVEAVAKRLQAAFPVVLPQ
jgi:hypothetical protein